MRYARTVVLDEVGGGASGRSTSAAGSVCYHLYISLRKKLSIRDILTSWSDMSV